MKIGRNRDHGTRGNDYLRNLRENPRKSARNKKSMEKTLKNRNCKI